MNRFSRLLRNFFVTVVAGGAAIGLCLAGIISGGAIIAGANVSTGDLNIRLSKLSQVSRIYAADGTQTGTLAAQDRQDVKLSEVPKVLINAVIATEDRTFWTNPGVDLSAVFRAFKDNVTSGRIEQGGSTITQQLVKNRLLTPKKNINRKIKELVISWRLNDELTKKKILEEYLNTVYFGQGAYGVQAAVRRFFSGPPFTPGEALKDVNLPQAALLAGVISNPEGNNPFLHPFQAVARRNDVLSRMYKQHYISYALMKFAQAVPLGLRPDLPPKEYQPDSFWSDAVYQRLVDGYEPGSSALGSTRLAREKELLRGGLKIYTTEDLSMQAKAQQAVDRPGVNRGFDLTLISMEPSTGQVKAMAKRIPFSENQYNVAIQKAGMDTGSTYKMITLAAAFQAGFSPNDTIDGAQPCFVATDRRPLHNAESGEGGIATVRSQTENSVNCAFYRMVVALGAPATGVAEATQGAQRVVDMSHTLGIGDVPKRDLAPVPAITLGRDNASPLEMAGVGAVLADQGVRHPPTFVTKIVDADGNTLLDRKSSPGQQALDPDVANCETDVLRGVLTRGTARGQGFNHVSAGKTGTTDNRTRAWFVGYTPQLSTAVAYGFPGSEQVGGAGFGAGVPAGTWRAFMQSALADAPQVAFPPAGPVCDRPSRFIDVSGRKPFAKAPAPLPLVPPSLPVAPGPKVPAPTPPTTAAKPVPPSSVPPVTKPTTPAPPP